MILTALMAHPRKLIRHAVVALLAGAATAAGVRVTGTRVDPHKGSQLPAISVYTLNDVVEEDVSTTAEDAHELEIEIVGWVAHSEAVPVDDAMDDLAEQIEAAMTSDPFLGGKVSELVFKGTTMEVREDDGRGNPLVGIVALVYTAKYAGDLATEDPANLDDFLEVDAQHRPVDIVEENQAHDQFVVQEIAP